MTVIQRVRRATPTHLPSSALLYLVGRKYPLNAVSIPRTKDSPMIT